MRNRLHSTVLFVVVHVILVPQSVSFAPVAPFLGAVAPFFGPIAPFFSGSFSLPKFEFPWDSINAASKSSQTSSLQPGDTVAVIGASGNVGKLVALRLSDTYKVNGIVRDASSVIDFFKGREDRIRLYESDLLEELTRDESERTDLYEALREANAIVICTGTTAFPTNAWSRSGEFSVTDKVIKALLENNLSVKDAISDLDQLGLNTPNNVDDRANQMVLRAWNDSCKVRKKRAIMLSSIGVQRRDTMPFPILNACGVLDAKAAGESSLIEAAAKGGYSYTIIRPGQLFGGPYDNNYYLGTLFQLDKDAATQDIQVGKGDELLGDTLRSTLAEITAQVCEGDCARDMDFAAVNVKGNPPSVDLVQERLLTL